MPNAMRIQSGSETMLVVHRARMDRIDRLTVRQDSTDHFRSTYQSLHPAQSTRTQGGGEQVEAFHEPAVEEAESVGSSSSSSIRNGSLSTRRTASMASRNFTRSSTQIEDNFMHYLDRHPTAIQRMQDHRLQHSQTVGSR